MFVLDFLKGTLAVTWFIYCFFVLRDPNLGVWGMPAAVLGHSYPIFVKFRGGKGVATAMVVCLQCLLA